MMGKRPSDPSKPRSPSAARGIKHPKKRAWLANYTLTGNMTLAAKAAGVSRFLYYFWCEHDEEFKLAAVQARESAADLLEEEARRRAYEGTEEPVIYQGKLVGAWVDDDGKTVSQYTSGAHLIPLTIRKYSDVLLIFMLKAVRPDKYREARTFSAQFGDGEKKSVTLAFGPGEDVP